MARGVSRHVVRFAAYDDRVYALKETDRAAAEREYRMLLALREENLPAVEPVGVARWRGGGEGARRRTGPGDADHPLPRLLAARTTTCSPAAGGPACSTACWTAARC